MLIVAHRSIPGDNVWNMSEAYDTLLQRAFQARREHRLEDAKEDLVEAVRLSRASTNPLEPAWALTRLGAIERDRGCRDTALRLYSEAVAIYRRLGERLRIAHSVRHLGDIHREMQRPDLAEPCYTEALSIYRAHPETPPLDLANAIRGLALLKSEAAEIEIARSLWSEAHKLYLAAGVPAGIEESSQHLG